MNKKEIYKIHFDLGVGGWHGYTTESLNATRLSDEKFRIENTPFFIKNVSFRDIVVANKKEDIFWFDRVIMRSGHSTYRVLINEITPPEKWGALWAVLEQSGCTYEVNRNLKLTMLAIDIPPHADLYFIYKVLEQGEREHIWEFEEAHVGHAIT